MVAEAKADGSSVVIVGYWNPAILQPPWLARNVFGGNADQAPVQTEVSLVAGQPPRYMMHGIRIAPAYDKLTVVPPGLEDAQLANCEEKIRAILGALPHTPVTAFGINFIFQDDEPSAAVLDLFADRELLAEATDLAFDTRATSFARAMAMNGYLLNFTRTLSSNNSVVYKFNFHYQVTDAAAAVALFNGAMIANLIIARRIAAAYDAKS
jgi:hypothetical protein